jgi:hypothetical protein
MLEGTNVVLEVEGNTELVVAGGLNRSFRSLRSFLTDEWLLFGVSPSHISRMLLPPSEAMLVGPRACTGCCLNTSDGPRSTTPQVQCSYTESMSSAKQMTFDCNQLASGRVEDDADVNEQIGRCRLVNCNVSSKVDQFNCYSHDERVNVEAIWWLCVAHSWRSGCWSKQKQIPLA